MTYILYFEPPKDFHPTVHVAGCFCEWQDKILYLKRHAEKPQGDTWGLPAGKLEKGEDSRTAAVREVQEEVGIQLNTDDLQEVVKLYIRLNNVDYVFTAFRARLLKTPKVQLDYDAHVEARWVTIEEALKLPLILGGKEILQVYQSKISSS
ncbi:MAG: NUDIX hydrolase [Verrucomicrobia bacterium]|nr:NUDIX hydrolase [Verrucomicrobiota bacterium]